MANGEKAPITLAGIKTFWWIVVIVATLAAQWAYVGFEVKQLRTDQCTIEDRLTAADAEAARHTTAVDEQLGNKVSNSETKLVEIQVQLAGIQRDIVYIRQLLDARK